MSDTLHIRTQKDTLWLLLDKQLLNPLTTSILEQLTAAIHKALKHPPRLIVITGMGERAFCSGIDLPNDSEVHRTELLRAAREADAALEEMRKLYIPTVALVKGCAFGAGCELAALCDTIIAREDALFRLPTANTKVFPSAVSLSLPALIGQENTERLMQSGKSLTAHDALHLGLAHQVLSTRRFVLDTEELLVMLASLGTQTHYAGGQSVVRSRAVGNNQH
jgi:enoyl-CoA hydratase/carnithine racemase